jgi:hypothetical protein
MPSHHRNAPTTSRTQGTPKPKFIPLYIGGTVAKDWPSQIEKTAAHVSVAEVIEPFRAKLL